MAYGRKFVTETEAIAAKGSFEGAEVWDVAQYKLYTTRNRRANYFVGTEGELMEALSTRDQGSDDPNKHKVGPKLAASKRRVEYLECLRTLEGFTKRDAKNKLAQCLGASEKERILDWYIPELVKGGKLRRVMDKKIQREARYYWVA